MDWWVTVAVVLGWFAGLAPFLVLIPWYFVAKHRGLAPRPRVSCVIRHSRTLLHVERGATPACYRLDAIVRARFAMNENWTESLLLEDALSLYAADGREIVRLGASAKGFEEVVARLKARGVPIEHVAVSAPAYLD